jgi:hypothetical protein
VINISFDLYPRNRELEPFRFGSFSWSWMLEKGVGLVLKTGRSIEPGRYRYVPDKQGRDPNQNDGYYVNSKLAKMMAHVARGLASVERGKHDEWNKMTEGERSSIKEWNERLKIYNLPVREDWIEKVEKFADWADKSGGFKIK